MATHPRVLDSHLILPPRTVSPRLHPLPGMRPPLLHPAPLRGSFFPVLRVDPGSRGVVLETSFLFDRTRLPFEPFRVPNSTGGIDPIEPERVQREWRRTRRRIRHDDDDVRRHEREQVRAGGPKHASEAKEGKDAGAWEGCDPMATWMVEREVETCRKANDAGGRRRPTTPTCGVRAATMASMEGRKTRRRDENGRKRNGGCQRQLWMRGRRLDVE